jgi:hypothetical protein
VKFRGFWLIIASIGGFSLSAPAFALAAPAGPAFTQSVLDPTQCGSACNLSGTTSVAVAGNYAYTTAYFSGKLTAIDISNPASPQIAGETPFSDNLVGGSTVNIAGGYAYVASKNLNGSTTSNDDGVSGNSLTIVDIHTNPAAPAIVGTIRDPIELFGAYGVAVSGNYAYVAAQGLLAGQPTTPDLSTGSFAIYDISAHGIPVPMGHLDNSALPAPYTGSNALHHACSVYVSGNYAYVTAAYSDDLTIIDISNPANPRIVSVLNDRSNDIHFDVDVAVQNNYAYVVDQISNGTLTVVDVSNPASPRIVGTVSSGPALNGAYRVRLDGAFAYVSASGNQTVAAVDIANPANPQIVGSLLDAAHLSHTTGLDVDPTSDGTYVVANSPRLSTESNPLYPPFPGQAGGPTTTGTISMIQLDPTPITVTIAPGSKPVDPTTQTTANFTFSTSDSVASDACSLDGAPLAPCGTETSQSYSSLPLGRHTFTVQATDAADITSQDSYSWTIGLAPTPTSPPAISGSTIVGNTLTATSNSATWTGSPTPTFAYQWQRCDASGTNCTAIAGATGLTYTTTAADVGSAIEFVVTGTSSSGSASSTSSPTSAITAVMPIGSPPANTSSPTVSGTTSEGSTLSATAGIWTGSPVPAFSYEWQHCNSSGAGCAIIAGATGSSYTTVAADIGSTMKVVVTGANILGSASATSAATAAITAVQPTDSPPKNTLAPKIFGPTRQGATLTAAEGTWTGSPAPAFTFQWQRCDSHGAECATITGATHSKYAPTAGDVGARIRVSVTGANSAGSATAVSNAVGPVSASVVVRQTSLAGIAQRRAKLVFTVDAATSARALRTIVVDLPKGLAFAKSRARLAKGAVVKSARGRRQRFTIELSHGSLKIILPTAAQRAQVTIAGSAITVAPSLATKVKDRKLRALDVILTTIDSRHRTVQLVLTLKPT